MAEQKEEKLIDAVQQREFLYNKRNELYRDNSARINAWTEIERLKSNPNPFLSFPFSSSHQ